MALVLTKPITRPDINRVRVVDIETWDKKAHRLVASCEVIDAASTVIRAVRICIANGGGTGATIHGNQLLGDQPVMDETAYDRLLVRVGDAIAAFASEAGYLPAGSVVPDDR